MIFATLQSIIASASKRAIPERLRLTKAAFVILAFLPFVSFGAFDYSENIRVVTVRLFTWSDFDVAPNRLSVPNYNLYNADELYSVFSSGQWGFKISLKRTTSTGYNYTLSVPSHSSVFTNSNQSSIGYCIQGYTNGTSVACAFSPLYFPSVSSLYQSAATLFSLGYRGSGVQWFQSSGTSSNFCVNVNYPVLVADVFGSTNTVFRRVLLSHLASIQSNLNNIDLNVSGLSTIIQQGNDDIIDALIGDYPEIQEELRKGNSRAVDVRTSIKSQLQAWRNEAKQQLNDWKSDLKSDLQAWKTSDETGILNVRQHIQDVTSAVDSMKNQFATVDSQGNTISFSAFTTNFVTVPITNVVTQSGNEISSNIQQAADMLDDRLYDIWDRFWNTAGRSDSDGINVRIVHPTDGDNHVLVKDDAVLRVLEDGVTFVSPELTQISDAWDSFLSSYSPTNSLDWEPWFQKWVPFSETVTNYYSEFNASEPVSEIAADFLDRGFDPRRFSGLTWFQRVEVLLAMIADVRSNSVDVADIQDDMQHQVENFQSLSTNVVLVSSDVVGLFGYVQRFSTSLQSIFSDRAAPLTGDYVLLSSGHWIGDQPLVLRINPAIQNLCRLIMQCIWYLGFLVLLWVVVNWCWQKVVAVLRWLWSMFDV